MRSFIRYSLAIVVTFATLACESFELDPPAQTLVKQEAGNTKDDQIVALVNSVDSAILLERKAVRRGYILVSKETLVGLDFVMLGFLPPRGLDGSTASAELEKLEPHATAGANHLYTLESEVKAESSHSSQQRFSDPRRYADAMLSWPASGCRAMAPIGMIDGSVDLAAAGVSGADIVTANFAGSVPAAKEHGTAIAELLVGQGRLTDARLYSAAVVSASPAQETASVTPIIRAIDWMYKNDVRIVNVSLAGPYNKILDRAIQRASDRGMIFVAAVGNNGASSPPRYPAAFKDVIAVTAIDSNQNIYANAVHGQHVEFAAPGVDVYVQAEGKGRYITGTSIAAPFVTTQLASDKINNSQINAKVVRKRLTQKVVDLGPEGRDPVYGLGLVRANNSCGV